MKKELKEKLLTNSSSELFLDKIRKISCSNTLSSNNLKNKHANFTNNINSNILRNSSNNNLKSNNNANTNSNINIIKEKPLVFKHNSFKDSSHSNKSINNNNYNISNTNSGNTGNNNNNNSSKNKNSSNNTNINSNNINNKSNKTTYYTNNTNNKQYNKARTQHFVLDNDSDDYENLKAKSKQDKHYFKFINNEKYVKALNYTYDYEYNKYYSNIVVEKSDSEDTDTYDKLRYDNSNSYVKKNKNKEQYNNKRNSYKILPQNKQIDYSNISDYFPDELAEKAYMVPPKNKQSFCFNPIKRIVSGGRIRFIDNQIDLDLSFITKRVVAMCFPSNNCLESLYRNSLYDVDLFFKKYLGMRVKVSFVVDNNYYYA